MFYDLKHRIGFIHIPRTGGVAISLGFLPHLSVGSGWDLGRLRHLPLFELCRLLGPDAEGMRWFTIYRPLNDILASYSRLVAKERKVLSAGGVLPKSWEQVVQSPDPLQEVWKRNGWPTTEPQWMAWWTSPIIVGQDGEQRCHHPSHPLELEVLPFSSLEAGLEALCRKWHMPTIKLPPHRIN